MVNFLENFIEFFYNKDKDSQLGKVAEQVQYDLLETKKKYK